MVKTFSFDSTRKRQSVLVRKGDVYKLLVKGADSSILPYLHTEFHHPYVLETEAYLTKFSLLGYRTLAFAERYFTKEQYEMISLKYKEAVMSEDRKEKIK